MMSRYLKFKTLKAIVTLFVLTHKVGLGQFLMWCNRSIAKTCVRRVRWWHSHRPPPTGWRIWPAWRGGGAWWGWGAWRAWGSWGRARRAGSGSWRCRPPGGDSGGILRSTHVHRGAADAVEDEEDVVQGNRADQIQKEPSSHIGSRDQLGVEDNLFAVISFHYP